MTALFSTAGTKHLVSQRRDASAVKRLKFKNVSRWSDFERVSKGGIGALRRRDMQSQLGERRLRRRQTGLVIRETGAESSEGGEGRGHFRGSGGVAEAIGGWGVVGHGHGQTGGHLVATHEQIQSNVLL